MSDGTNGSGKFFDAYPEGEYGKEAISHYKVLERFGYVTLIQCELETGRTHQIRVHMQHIGHPLFNDELIWRRENCEGNGVHQVQAICRQLHLLFVPGTHCMQKLLGLFILKQKRK